MRRPSRSVCWQCTYWIAGREHHGEGERDELVDDESEHYTQGSFGAQRPSFKSARKSFRIIKRTRDLESTRAWSCCAQKPGFNFAHEIPQTREDVRFVLLEQIKWPPSHRLFQKKCVPKHLVSVSVCLFLKQSVAQADPSRA